MNLFDDMAEQDVLSSILFKAEECEWALNNLKEEHFYSAKCRQLFIRMSELLKEGTDISLVTVGENYDGDMDFLMNLMTNAYTASRSKSSAEVVLNQYYKRKANSMLIEAQKHLGEHTCTIDTLRERTEDIAFFLSFRSKLRTLMPLEDIAKETLDNLDDIAESGTAGISSGFKRADELGWTFRPGTFSIIGARPAMGKSALALDIAENCGVPCAFFSLEMKGLEQFERMLSKRMGIPNNQLRSPEFIKKYRDEIAKVSTKLVDAPIFINDSPTISPLQLRMQVKRAIAKYGIRLVIVDYMGYMNGTREDKEGGRRIEMGNYSRAMKEMSKELDIASIGLAQLNRDCESRDNKRPTLADLKETGDLEQDAHMVWFLYRDYVYDPEKSDPSLAELINRKTRGGEIGTIKLDWNGRLTRFKDWEQDQQSFDANDWTSKYD